MAATTVTNFEALSDTKNMFLLHDGDWRHKAEFSGSHKDGKQIIYSKTGGKVWHLFPDFKVFINGIDFTDFVTSITINHNNLGQPSTCSLNLINPELLLNYSIENSKGTFGGTAQSSNSRPSSSGLQGGSRLNYRIPLKSNATNTSAPTSNTDGPPITNKTFEIGETIKQQMYESKKEYQGGDDYEGLTFGEGSKSGSFNKSSFSKGSSGAGGSYQMWTLSPGDCCIDSMDPIRIFFKNPYISNAYDNMSGGEADKQWYYAFTGFIDTVTETEDSEMNASLAIAASDVRKIMKNSRLATNNGVNIPLMDGERIDLLQKDVGAPGAYTTKFANLTMPQIIISAINGTDWLINSGSNNLHTDGNVEDPIGGVSHNEGDKIGGVGEWDTYLYGVQKGSESSSLSEWQTLFDMRLPFGSESDGDEQETVYGAGKGCRWGGARFPGNQHKDRMFILVPGSGFGVGNSVATKDIRNNYSLYTEFVNRLDVLNELVQQMEMEFYTTPRGDLVFEVKLYAFNPQDFGSRYGTENFLNQTDWGCYQEDLGITNYSITDSDSEVQTFVRVTGRFQNMSDFNDEISMQGMAPLAGAYGMGKPVAGKSTPTFGPVSMFEKGQLRRFGLRYFQKQLPHIWDSDILQKYAEGLYAMYRAKIKSASCTMLPNYELGINRPFLLGPRIKQFTVENIVHSVSWQGSIDTTVSLTFPRCWLENKQKFEELINPFLLDSTTQKPVTAQEMEAAQIQAAELKSSQSRKTAEELVAEDPTLTPEQKSQLLTDMANANEKLNPQQANMMNDKITEAAQSNLSNNAKGMPPTDPMSAYSDVMNEYGGLANTGATAGTAAPGAGGEGGMGGGLGGMASNAMGGASEGLGGSVMNSALGATTSMGGGIGGAGTGGATGTEGGTGNMAADIATNMLANSGEE